MVPETASSRAESDDDALVRAARDGDGAALDALLRRHESTVLRVLRLLGVPRDDREDVAQEVLVRIFRFLDGYRPGRSFSAWVYRITVNSAHDYRGRRRRRERDESALRAADSDGATGRASGPEAAGEAADLRRRLERALARLTERERAVFVLRELEGLSSADVSRSLGISGITVRRHLGRARRRLQRILGSESPQR